MSETEEGAKAVKEVAKTTGKAVDALREAGAFLAKYIKGPLDQASAIVEDRLKYIRWERQIRLMLRADEFLSSAGLAAPTRSVPLKVAIPIMVDGSLEEDDKLQDIWAQLLANAADRDSGVEVHHMFLSILKDLTSQDVQVLNLIYAVTEEDASTGIWTAHLPDQIILNKNLAQGEVVKKSPTPEMQLSLSNLYRLGLLTVTSTWGGGSLTFNYIMQTVLGREFVRACSFRSHG